MTPPLLPSLRLLGSALCAVALSFAAPASAQLLLTEVQSNQAAGSVDDYWELTNFGPDEVDLEGYTWDDDRANRTIALAWALPAGTKIAPGESVIFTRNVTPAAFRAWWGPANVPTSVQIFNSVGSPGLGTADQINLWDKDGNLVFNFSYAAGGFTRSDGTGSTGGHAGLSAGGPTNTRAAIWDPAFGIVTPRYTFADGTTLRTFASAANAADIGSPGRSGLPTFNLSLSITPDTFSESAANPAATGTVTRDGSTVLPVVVSLSSSDFTEATVPATVTIPAGQASATFDVTAVDDEVLDGDQVVTITASAINAEPGTFNITVQDDGDPPYTGRLLITEIQSSQSALGKADWWELTNFGDDAVDLSNYRWNDEARNFFTAGAWAVPPGTSIDPGESIIFTTLDPTDFRTWWGIAESVQVIQSPGAPGLGQNDAIAFFDDGANERAFLSYAENGFTRSNGDSASGGHAGISAGGDQTHQSLIWDPESTFEAPRYTFADGSTKGTFVATEGADTGSPGFSGFVILPPAPRPDVAVGFAPNRLVGANAYGSPPTQQVNIISRGARPVTGFAAIANRGTLAESIRVRATPGNANFPVLYRVGAANVTAALRNGSYATPTLSSASAPVLIQARVTPSRARLVRRVRGRQVVRKATFLSLVQASSSSAPGTRDAGRIRIQTR
jgi:hypothetical protein